MQVAINSKPTPKQEQIIALQTEHPHITRRELAKQADTSTSYVQEVLERYNLTKQNIDDFKDNRADVFAGLQHRIISSITEQDIQKAPMGSRVLAAAQLYDKERIERGLSTENVSYHVVTEDISKVNKEITRLERELARLQSQESMGTSLGASDSIDASNSI